MSLRENPLGELKVPLTWTAAAALVVAAVAAVTVLVSDRRESFQAEAYGATRGIADRVLTPVGNLFSAPGRWAGNGIEGIQGYFFATSENRRLKAELKEMGQWRDTALALRNENNRYRTLLGLKIDPPIPMVAGRVVTDSHGPFANTRLIDAGTKSGVKIGNPVMSENGLVGRIIGVTGGASRLLLTTDTASRIPVMIDRTNARAILTGDGGPNPKLEYMRGRDPVREGDRVMTSGDGGVLPRGLPIGSAVVGLDGRWRVVLASDKAPIDFVRILLFQDFSQLVNQKQLDEKRIPPPAVGLDTDAGGAAHAPAPAVSTSREGTARPAPAVTIEPTSASRGASPPPRPDPVGAKASARPVGRSAPARPATPKPAAPAAPAASEAAAPAAATRDEPEDPPH